MPICNFQSSLRVILSYACTFAQIYYSNGMNNKHIIFNFDGTLADTRQSIIQTLQATLKELHLSEAEEEQIKHLIGLPLRDTLYKPDIFKTRICLKRQSEV